MGSQSKGLILLHVLLVNDMPLSNPLLEGNGSFLEIMILVVILTAKKKLQKLQDGVFGVEK